MKAFAQLRCFLANVAGYCAQMIVVREAVQMNQNLDVVTVLQKGRHEVFIRDTLSRAGSQPLRLKCM